MAKEKLRRAGRWLASKGHPRRAGLVCGTFVVLLALMLPEQGSSFAEVVAAAVVVAIPVGLLLWRRELRRMRDRAFGIEEKRGQTLFGKPIRRRSS